VKKVQQQRASITLANAFDVAYFAPGLRIATTGGHGLRARIWRWLTKQNLRVVSVSAEAGFITVERCR
jgi:hypothetical protein